MAKCEHVWQIHPDQDNTGTSGVRKFCNKCRQVLTFYEPWEELNGSAGRNPPMNSKLQDILVDLATTYAAEYRLRNEAKTDLTVAIHQSNANKAVVKAEKAIRQAVGDEMLEIVGPDIYPERPSGGSNSWKAQDELRAELRQKIKSWAGDGDK